jgi:hypothetical protein
MSNGKCKPPKEILPRDSICSSLILNDFMAYINKSSPIDVKITERIHLISIGINHSISVGVNDSSVKILLIVTLIVILIV